MNDSTHPSNATGPASQPPGGGFFSWIRGLGIARRDDRWFAGVASGIAARAGIDPLIVRGIFVVLALLGGPGILLYVVGWLLLPDTGGRIHVEEIIRGRAETWVMVTGIVLASVLLLPVIFGLLGIGGSPFSGLWGWAGWMMPEWISVTFSVLWWIAVIGGGVWLLVWALNQKSRGSGSTGSAEPTGPERSAGPGAGAAADPASAKRTEPFGARGGQSPAAAPGPTVEADRTAEPGRTAESSRTAEPGEEWSERMSKWGETYAAQHEARSLGASQVVITFALALLAGGAAAFWAAGGWAGLGDPDAAADPWQILTLGLVGAVAVLALSVIVAGVRGRTTGWVGFLAFCGVVALLFTSVLPWGVRFQPFGVASVACCGSEADDSGIAVIAGSARVDLSGLDDRTETSEFEVWMAAGNTSVYLPEEAPTVVDIRVFAGNIRERSTGSDGYRVSGPFLSRSVSANLEDASDAGTDESVNRVTVYLFAGNVQVHGADGARGATSGTDPALETDERRLQELLDEQESVQDELDVIEWEMQNPSATDAEIAGLERRHEKLEAELDDLEKETAR